jgi:hypothetical protein
MLFPLSPLRIPCGKSTRRKTADAGLQRIKTPHHIYTRIGGVGGSRKCMQKQQRIKRRKAAKDPATPEFLSTNMP